MSHSVLWMWELPGWLFVRLWCAWWLCLHDKPSFGRFHLKLLELLIRWHILQLNQSECDHPHKTQAPGAAFPLCVLYKQTELEKSSHWNIISSCHIWSVCLAACGLFNQSEHKGPNLQTCCEQTTVKGRAQAWMAPAQGANQPRARFHELWLGRNVLC